MFTCGRFAVKKYFSISIHPWKDYVACKESNNTYKENRLEKFRGI